MTVLPDPPVDPAHAAGRPADPTPPRTAVSRRDRLVPFVAGLAVMLAVVLGAAAVSQGEEPLTEAQVAQAIEDALASQAPDPPLAEQVYAAIRPSIVLIESRTTDASGNSTGREGTGVVVSPDGAILTALHVVEGSTEIEVVFADGSRSAATLTSSDEAQDIAALQAGAMPATIPPAVLGSPGALRIGSDAFIVGNPFGLYGSMSTGVVSGLDRTFRDPDTDRVHEGLIQVDAAVNPGNSGGPLLDRAGRVVGIVTALVNPTDQDVFIGIGLAVPIDVAGGGAGLPPF
jgi:S1-C subfamily serine protease